MHFSSFVNKLEYLVDASAVIACIENVPALNNNCLYVIGGDFNFDCDMRSSHDKLSFTYFTSFTNFYIHIFLRKT